jgi:cell division control protein 24
MAHAPALLRTNTAPIFPVQHKLGSISSASGISGPRSSQLTGTTIFGSASNVSLPSMATPPSGNGEPVSGGPVIATANIINQKADASRSLYQICISLKTRLFQVPGFDQYQQELDELTASSDGGPVEALWNLMRTGHPLLTIYNALQPDAPLTVEGTTGSPEKVSKIAIFRFVQACMAQLRIPSNECFVINDLMGNDTTGFVKVLTPSCASPPVDRNYWHSS